MTFKPSIGLEGFRVISTFDIETFNCQKLENHIYQLAVILYPAELVNEKFLINVRNCMVKLPDSHPVKKWLKSQSTPKKPDPKDEKKIEFLNEMLNSQFNLITDQKVKTQVISLISDIPGTTNIEQLLKSYLYLMIGNITRSDNLMKSVISQSPREFYQGFSMNNSYYHRLTLEHLDKVLRKFSRHPADRLSFSLLNLYIQSYLNKTDLLELSDEVAPEELGEKLGLAYTERMAPELVRYGRLKSMTEKRKFRNLRLPKYSEEMQCYWVWAFIDISPLVSESMAAKVKSLDEADPLWAIYLLDDEKLADLYFKKGGQPLSRRRGYLRKNLENPRDFMLSLYKLIQLGDIDEGLVQEVSRFMNQDG